MAFREKDYIGNNSLERVIRNVCNCDYKYFLNKKNVVGVGLGYKRRGGFYIWKKCIQVFVSKKILKCRLYSKDVIPKFFKGVQTDVVETGIFKACTLRNRIRPVKGGYSIGADIYRNSGTAGCLVTNGVLNFLLGCNHILAEENEAPIGNSILQPSFLYGGREPRDTIASLHRFVPLRFIEGGREPVNYSDCAIGLLKSPNILTSEIAFIGKITCIKSPRLNERVKKVGSTTELTEGVITSVNVTVINGYEEGKNALFQDAIFTTDMAESGDSGAVLINKNKCGVGLIFGAANNNTVCCRLDIVLDQLDVHLP